MSLSLDKSYFEGMFEDADFSTADELKKYAYDKVLKRDGEGAVMLGWAELPKNYDRDEIKRIRNISKEIRSKCDAFILIGIGGSYLGTRAGVDFIKSSFYNSFAKDTPKIYYLGNNVSTDYISAVLEECKDKEVCVNVISKSGTTAEPAISFLLVNDFMLKKYGEAAYSRIYVTTDPQKGTMLDFANKHGCTKFSVPSDIGGRYSVLTPVGLLPLAVCGCDIDAILAGAYKAYQKYYQGGIDNNDALYLAFARYFLGEKGRCLELFTSYEPDICNFTAWCCQLFGESEGKDGKGMFPSPAVFSTDLHSLGQYIQDGRRTMIETAIYIENPNDKIKIPNDLAVDGLDYLRGKDLSDINNYILKAAATAHKDANVPTFIIRVDKKDEENFGMLVYFLELVCAFTAYMLKVNPFNQPGVEAYKNYMYRFLGKNK